MPYKRAPCAFDVLKLEFSTTCELLKTCQKLRPCFTWRPSLALSLWSSNPGKAATPTTSVCRFAGVYSRSRNEKAPARQELSYKQNYILDKLQLPELLRLGIRNVAPINQERAHQPERFRVQTGVRVA